MLIRQEKEQDFAAIYDLVKKAFATAKVSNGDEQNFVTRLRASKNYIPELALVAEEAGQIIGHIMLTNTFISVDDDRHDTLLLAPISVALEHRGKGVGGKLIEEAFRIAKEKGHTSAVLVGDPEYYKHFGFKASAEYEISNTNEIPGQYVLACELVPDALQNTGGSITFET